MKIKPRRHTMYNVVHSFFPMTGTGTQRVEVHPQGHTVAYLKRKAELESKSLTFHPMLYFLLTHSHTDP